MHRAAARYSSPTFAGLGAKGWRLLPALPVQGKAWAAAFRHGALPKGVVTGQGAGWGNPPGPDSLTKWEGTTMDQKRNHEWIKTPDGRVIAARYAGEHLRRRRTRKALHKLILASASVAERRRLEALFGVGEED